MHVLFYPCVAIAGFQFVLGAFVCATYNHAVHLIRLNIPHTGAVALRFQFRYTVVGVFFGTETSNNHVVFFLWLLLRGVSLLCFLSRLGGFLLRLFVLIGGLTFIGGVVLRRLIVAI